MKTERQITGRKGEEQACAYLQSIGHSIVARNWRSGHCELDIISYTQGELHIVEVKSRTAPVLAAPEVNVNGAKRRKLVAGANAFLNSESRRAVPADVEICFDVVTVVFDGTEIEIEYYPNAFIPTYV